MSTLLWVVEAAAAFWAAAGGPEPFPRTLERAIIRALPLSIVPLSRLSVAAVAHWLGSQGIVGLALVTDRRLRACLVARYGHGFIFLDRDDPPAEQRFSLAHELAHFLHDYQLPRATVVARLGPAAQEVLDGDRPPTRAERIDAVLAQVSLAPHVHFMERTEDGHPTRAVVSAAERDADRLAFELLAPAEVVLHRARDTASARGPEALTHLLIAEFGLPAVPARQYAALLAPSRPPRSFLDQLGFPRSGSRAEP